MSSLENKIETVRVTGRQLQVGLADGREIRLPLSLYPTLAEAGVAARSKWELCGAGTGIEWPLLNYHLSAAGLLRGEPEAPGIAKAKKGRKYPAPKPAGALALAEEPPAPVAADVSSRQPVSEGRAGCPQPAESGAVGTPRPTARPSTLVDTRVVYCGDCLEQLRNLPDRCVDLIYIDPPFNSNRNYEVFWGETKEKRAFDDRHASTAAYIDFMRPRCVELARVLKPTGSFYYHCDWHASHYVKVLLDQIFGENNFQSEIIWKRTSSHGNVGRGFGSITDSIFFFAGSSEFTWNQIYVPYSTEHIENKFTGVDPDGRRYTTSDLRNPGVRPNLRYDYQASNGITYKPHPNGWAVCREVMEQYDREGRLYFPKDPSGRLRLKRYLDETQGERIQNLWDDISPINSQAAERLGYPTQKPLALLERIVQASSNKNDIVLDAFCGCGTALVAAQKLKRQWIGIDVSPTACRVMAKRLRDVCGLPEDEQLWKAGRGFVVRDLPWTEEKLRAIPPFEFENWAVIALGGLPNKTQVGDRGIDGRIYPVSAAPERRGKAKGEFEFTDVWYPVQVKQKDKAGRPDIDAFQAVMMREERTVGFFVAFDYSEDARAEIGDFFKRTGKIIRALTVQDILDEAKLGMKLA